MKSAILLLGFNRIDYFTKVLTSLEQNKAAYEHDLFVYIDGGPKARQEEIKELWQTPNFEMLKLFVESMVGHRSHLIDAVGAI